MRSFGLILASVLLAPIVSAQQGIRQVDFKNFTYPISGNLLGHRSLQWLTVTSSVSGKSRSIHLVNGAERESTSRFEDAAKGGSQHRGFTIESVKYADLTGDGNEEAIVVLLYQTGGTQATDYVYVYKLVENHPVLLAFCHTGDRAYRGLYQVYAETGALIFELFDPDKRQGDCCSSSVVIEQFKWQGDHFAKSGLDMHRALER